MEEDHDLAKQNLDKVRFLSGKIEKMKEELAGCQSIISALMQDRALVKRKVERLRLTSIARELAPELGVIPCRVPYERTTAIVRMKRYPQYGVACYDVPTAATTFVATGYNIYARFQLLHMEGRQGTGFYKVFSNSEGNNVKDMLAGEAVKRGIHTLFMFEARFWDNPYVRARDVKDIWDTIKRDDGRYPPVSRSEFREWSRDFSTHFWMALFEGNNPPNVKPFGPQFPEMD